MVMADEQAPTTGTERWEAWVEKLIAERDEARVEIRRLEANLTAHKVETEAELTNLNRAAGALVAVCRNIINNPLTSRTDVQSRLTLAMQAFEREMGEGWT
jgi:hypothetical protein